MDHGPVCPWNSELTIIYFLQVVTGVLVCNTDDERNDHVTSPLCMGSRRS